MYNNYKIKNRLITRSRLREAELEVMQFNCNGLAKKLSEVKVFIYCRKPDIVCLSETWLKKSEPRFLGYKAWWQHRIGAEKGGMAILVREDIDYVVKNIEGFAEGKLELMSMDISTQVGRVQVVNVYNPGKDITTEEFSHYINRCNRKFILVGDFNAHHPLWDARQRTNRSGVAISRVLEDYNLGMLNSVNIPTYIDKRHGTTSCLDLCIVPAVLAVRGSMERLSDLGSDHFPMLSRFSFGVEKSNLNEVPKWKVKQVDWVVFGQVLDKNNHLVTQEVVPNNAAQLNNIFTQKVLVAAEECIPKTTGKKLYKYTTPWWDQEISKHVAQRRKAKGQLWRHPTVEN